MRIRRILAAVIATAALAGLGLTSAAAASLTPGECEQGGGTVNRATNTCSGGMFDGQMVD